MFIIVLDYIFFYKNIFFNACENCFVYIYMYKMYDCDVCKSEVGICSERILNKTQKTYLFSHTTYHC